MARGQRTDPEVVAEARRLLANGHTYVNAAAAVGIPTYTLYGLIPADNEASRRAAATRTMATAVLADATPPRTDGDGQSLKTRMLAAIAGSGPFASTSELMDAVRRPGDNFDAHEVYHLLHSLKKSSLITFTLGRGRGGGVGTKNGTTRSATHIRATASGYASAHVTPAFEVPVVNPWQDALDRYDAAPGVDPEPDPEPTAAPPPVRRYPILSGLFGRRDAHERAVERAGKLLEAATLLEDVDADESARLLGLAEAATASTALTPIELEYLAYAIDHADR